MLTQKEYFDITSVYLKTGSLILLWIALLAVLVGCGYKDDPFYPRETEKAANAV